MAKVNPYSTIKRPPQETRVFDFSCGVSQLRFSIELRRLTSLESVEAMEQGNELYQYHVTGSGPAIEKGPHKGELDEDHPNYNPPVPLPPVGGKGVIVSKSTCRMLAILCEAQVADGDDRYRFEELAAFATSDSIAADFIEASVWVQPVLVPWEHETNPTEGSGSGSASTE